MAPSTLAQGAFAENPADINKAHKVLNRRWVAGIVTG
jgi:hypothetical protein